MHVLHIDNAEEAHKVEKHVKKGDDVFVLVYMEGCGPCNATRPEWAKIDEALREQYSNNDKLTVIDINKDFIKGIEHIGKVDGFPTMKYIGDYGNNVELYENSGIHKKDRSIDSFINWIESKITKMESTSNASTSNASTSNASNSVSVDTDAMTVYHRIKSKHRRRRTKHRRRRTKHRRTKHRRRRR